MHCCVLCCLVIAFLWLHFFAFFLHIFALFLHFFALHFLDSSFALPPPPPALDQQRCGGIVHRTVAGSEGAWAYRNMDGWPGPLDDMQMACPHGLTRRLPSACRGMDAWEESMTCHIGRTQGKGRQQPGSFTCTPPPPPSDGGGAARDPAILPNYLNSYSPGLWTRAPPCPPGFSVRQFPNGDHKKRAPKAVESFLGRSGGGGRHSVQKSWMRSEISQNDQCDVAIVLRYAFCGHPPPPPASGSGCTWSTARATARLRDS